MNNISLEEKLQQKLQDAELFQHSEEQRGALWTEISKKSAAVSPSTSYPAVKYFVQIFSNKTSVFIGAGLVVGVLLFFGLTSREKQSEQKNEMSEIRHDVASQYMEQNQLISEDSKTVSSASDFDNNINNQNLSEEEKLVEKRGNEFIEQSLPGAEIIKADREKKIPGEEVEKTGTITASANDYEATEQLQTADAAEPREYTTTKDEDVLYEDSTTVYVKKPVIIENRKVKIVKERSKFSKRVKSKKK